MALPEFFFIILHYPFIKLISFLRNGERVVASSHYEEDYSSRKDVNFDAVVFFSLNYFRCHVLYRSNSFMKFGISISSDVSGCYSEISYFWNKRLIKKNVLWFQIPMCKAVIMTMLNTLKDLSEVIFGHRFVELSRKFNDIKKLTLVGNVEHQIIKHHWNITHCPNFHFTILL